MAVPEALRASMSEAGGKVPGRCVLKITSVKAYQVDLPMKEGSYSWADQTFAAFDSTILIVETDQGLSGVGEVCPLGPAYLPAYAEGARTGLKKLAEGLIGENPIELDGINYRMDRLIKGHPYVKSAFDLACWDILGKATGLPVYQLLGGKLHDRVKLFKVIGRMAPEAMADKVDEYRELGYSQFQMKVGENAAVDIERIHHVAERLNGNDVLGADANTGWRQHEAIRVAAAIADIDLYLEQPCLTYEECLAVRRHTDRPIILDECMDSLQMLLRGHADNAMDLVNLKINRLGGLTRSRQFRDLCVSLGIVMTIEDSWGSEIATAAIAHLAHSTPPGFHFQSSPFQEYTDVVTADGAPEVGGGFMVAPSRPGLGVTARREVLTDPVFEVR